MALYKLFSCNLEVQYKSYFLSKAMLFTLFTTLINVILPFIIAYRGKGFWLKTERFYEKPSVHFSYDYLLVLETEDPSTPVVCGNAASLPAFKYDEEYCADFEVQESGCDGHNTNCMLDLTFNVNVPPDRTVTSVTMILGLDFQLKSLCPLHMQSLAVINRDFAVPPSGLQVHGDLQLYQVKHLPCLKNTVDTKYNDSLFDVYEDANENVVDWMFRNYFHREVTTQLKTIHSRAFNGHTGTINLQVHIRIPEMKIRYIPSLFQELKWAWPQYLSLVVVFYWAINRIKRFVFNHRLLMAWEVLPWKQKVLVQN